MQSIETKYLPYTNTRQSRVSARCQAKRIIVAWDHALTVEENHVEAAAKLVSMMGWDGPEYGEWVHGDNVKGNGYTFVHVN